MKTLQEIIEEKAKKNGWELLAIHEPSHPDDKKVYCYTLCQKEAYNGTTEYMTHSFNKEYEGFSGGHYYKDLDEAREALLKRL